MGCGGSKVGPPEKQAQASKPHGPKTKAETLAAQYTEPEALLAALRKKDVQLLSARWVLGDSARWLRGGGGGGGAGI